MDKKMMARDENSLMDLYQAFNKVKSFDEFKNFINDLCTPAEMSAMAERWAIVLLLNEQHSYREIREKTGSSLATITRVARFLRQERYQGYNLVLKRLKKGKG